MKPAKSSGQPESLSSAPLAREFQQMWLGLMRQPTWRSLVLVPADPGTSARQLARSLSELTRFFELGQVRVIEGEGLSLADASKLAHEITAQRETVRTVAAVDFPLSSPGAIPLVMAADAALLVVRLGKTRREAAHGVIELVGRDRLLGAITLERQG